MTVADHEQRRSAGTPVEIPEHVTDRIGGKAYFDWNLIEFNWQSFRPDPFIPFPGSNGVHGI